MVLYSIVYQSTVKYSARWYGTIGCSTVQYSTVHWGIVKYSILQYSIEKLRIVQYKPVQLSKIYSVDNANFFIASEFFYPMYQPKYVFFKIGAISDQNQYKKGAIVMSHLQQVFF